MKLIRPILISIAAMMLAGSAAYSALDGSSIPPLTHAVATTDTPCDGLLGAKWRDSEDTVTKQLATQDYTPETSKNGTTEFNSADTTTLAGEQVDNIKCDFCSLGLTRISVQYENNVADKKYVDQYNRLKGLLAKKYGAPDIDVKTFQSPYTEGDGKEDDAIFAGDADLHAQWNLKSSSGDSVHIKIQITQTWDVIVAYEDEDMMDTFNKEHDAANANEL